MPGNVTPQVLETLVTDPGKTYVRLSEASVAAIAAAGGTGTGTGTGTTGGVSLTLLLSGLFYTTV